MAVIGRQFFSQNSVQFTMKLYTAWLHEQCSCDLTLLCANVLYALGGVLDNHPVVRRSRFGSMIDDRNVDFNSVNVQSGTCINFSNYQNSLIFL